MFRSFSAKAMVLFSMGLLAFVLSWPQAHAEDLPPCREAWSALIPKGQHKYDYEKHAQQTATGNLGYSSWKRPLARTQCKKEWTVLVYIAADNDLHPYALADIYEMEAGFQSSHYAGSTLKTDLLVELDDQGEGGARRLHIFETPEVYEPGLKIEDFQQKEVADIRSPIVGFSKERGRGHDVRFKEFLQWGAENYPAQHYMVVLWGHGQGWTSIPPEKGRESHYLKPQQLDLFLKNTPVEQLALDESPGGRRFGGIAFDEGEGSYLDIPSLQRILAQVQEDSLKGQVFDLYVSDACLMQMLEVAYELAPHTRFVVGSAQVHNFLGLPYRRLMYELNSGHFAGYRRDLYGADHEGPVDEAFLLSQAIPDIFKSSLNPHGFPGLQAHLDPAGYKSLTMSSLSSAELINVLIPSLESLAKQVVAYIDERPVRRFEVQYVFESTPSFGQGIKDLGLFVGLFKELLKREEVLEGVLTEEARRLRFQLNEVQDALQRAVVNHAVGEDFIQLQRAHPIFSATGLWLPASREDFAARVQDLSRSRFYSGSSESSGEGGWLRMMRQVYEKSQ